MVTKVELIECNPMYAHIRYPDGRESNVSIRDLAPFYEPECGVSDHAHIPVNATDSPVPIDADATDKVDPAVNHADLNKNNASAFAEMFAEDDMTEEFPGFPSDADIDSARVPSTEFYSNRLSAESADSSSENVPGMNTEPRRSSRSNKGSPPERYSASSY